MTTNRRDAGGYVPLSRQALRRPDLSPRDKVILMAILDHGYHRREDGTCRATNAEIGEAVGGLADSNVRDSVARLEEAGYLSRNGKESRSRALALLCDRYGNLAGNPPEIGRVPEAEPARNRAGSAPPNPPEIGRVPEANPPEIGRVRDPEPARFQAGHPLRVLINTTPSSTLPGNSAANGAAAAAAIAPLPGGEAQAPPADPECGDDGSGIGGEPTTLAELVAWIPTVTDNPRVLKNAPAWVERVALRLPRLAPAAIEWVVDAIWRAIDNVTDDPEDPRGGQSAYAAACLSRWIQAGGRPHVEIAEEAARAAQEASRPAEDRRAAEKARAAQEAAQALQRDADDRARWDRLPARDRDAIESAVLDAHPELRPDRMRRFALAACIEEMGRRMGRGAAS